MPRKAATPSENGDSAVFPFLEHQQQHGDDQQREEDVEGALLIEQPGRQRLRHGQQE